MDLVNNMRKSWTIVTMAKGKTCYDREQDVNPDEVKLVSSCSKLIKNETNFNIEKKIKLLPQCFTDKVYNCVYSNDISD